jgi:hypothetical protein
MEATILLDSHDHATLLRLWEGIKTYSDVYMDRELWREANTPTTNAPRLLAESIDTYDRSTDENIS